jgi:glycerate kinase
MKIIIAPDSFKGSLDALSVAQAVKNGVKRVLNKAQVILCPVADGGEGTLKILTSALGGKIFISSVHGPLMNPLQAQWGWLERDKTAIIEVASVAGLTLINPSLRDPLKTSTFGVGEIILKALDKGAKKIIIGLGGSTTCDGGCGMAEALGVRFSGCDSPLTGEKLIKISAIDLTSLDKRILKTEFLAAYDVTNPLSGISGSALVFAPQKGADESGVQLLEKGLIHLASFFEDVPTDFKGAGAAGGLGWGAVAFLNAKTKSGIGLCLDSIGFNSMLNGADLVITGEGYFDSQTFEGKAVWGVTQRAKALNIPVIVLAGNHDPDEHNFNKYGITECYSLCRYFKISTTQAMTNTAELLATMAAQIIIKKYSPKK